MCIIRFQKFFLILGISLVKTLAIPAALCRSLTIAILLYILGIFYEQCTSTFLLLVYLWLFSVLFIPLIILVSKSFSGLTSRVHLIFACWLLSSSNNVSGWSFWHLFSITNKSLIKFRLKWNYNLLLCLKHINTEKDNDSKRATHRAAIYLLVNLCW